MFARLPSLTLVRLWAALLLAAIGMQAAQPFRAPLEARHGSAFSATTYDVAVAPQRRVEGRQAPPLALPTPPVERAIAPPSPRPALVFASAPRPDSTGPPIDDILIRQAAPRAPPIA